MSDPAPRRRRLRFSLRSLILVIVLISSGTGLWYRWEPWVLDEFSRFDTDWKNVEGPEPYELLLGKEAFVYRPIHRESEIVGLVRGDKWRRPLADHPNREVVALLNLETMVQIWDKQTRSLLWETDMPQELYAERFVNFGIPGYRLLFSKSGDRLCLMMNISDAVSLWHRRRPEYWWGVAWLPEFWLTVVLCGGLVFSLWRDSRIMRA